MEDKEIIFDFNQERDKIKSNSLFKEKSGGLKFAASEGKEELTGLSPWKILIVDDQEEVHQVTQMVLSDFSFRNRKVKFISAYSAAEAKEVLINQSDRKSVV